MSPPLRLREDITRCNSNHFRADPTSRRNLDPPRSCPPEPIGLDCPSDESGRGFRQSEREDPMKILIASTPATGHVNPLLAIGRILIAEGHEVVGLSGSTLRERIESIGAGFRPFPPGADFDLGDIISVAPELKNTPPGSEWLRIAMERLFVDPLAAQHKGLQQALRDFPADVIIGDDMIFGVL